MQSLPPIPKERQARKRKRKHYIHDESQSSSLPHLSRDVINPFSRSPGERRQLSLAGLGDTDEDPTRRIKNFPHRGLDQEESESEQSEEEEDDDDELLEIGGPYHPVPLGGDEESHSKTTKQKQIKMTHRNSRLDTLLRSTHQLLDQGNIKRAARLFGLILQLRPDSRPIDIRNHNLWAIGAEIIMRQGEEAAVSQTHEKIAQPQEYTHIRVPRRWGSAANINKLKAYFATLIQKYPYDYRLPKNVSGLDFQLAMIGCEIYNCHAVYTTALEQLQSGRGDMEDSFVPEQEYDPDSNFNNMAQPDPMYDSSHGNEGRWYDEKERVRLQACETMKAIAKRMDEMISETPYSKNNHFLQLRATASLFIADLLIPTYESELENREEIEAAREQLQDMAIKLLEKVAAKGGHIAKPLLESLGLHPDQEQEPREQQLYASLPIRGA